MILILSELQDRAVAQVLPHLDALGARYHFIDVASHPFEHKLSYAFEGNQCQVVVGDKGLRIPGHDVSAVWYRWRGRLDFTRESPIKSAVLRQYVANTTLSVVSSLEGLLPNAYWLYPIHAGRQAYERAYNLRVATDVGFQVPETLMTNAPDAARAFIERHEFVAVKQAGTESICFDSETDSGTRHRVPLFTRRLSRTAALRQVAALDKCAFILQQYVEKKFEVRVTVVEDEAHACAMWTQESRSEDVRIDFRSRRPNGPLSDVRMEPYALPPSVAAKCIELTRRLGLRYGAIDLIATPSGEFVFLDLSPNGQWQWFAERAGLPIAQSIARALATRGGKDFYLRKLSQSIHLSTPCGDVQ